MIVSILSKKNLISYHIIIIIINVKILLYKTKIRKIPKTMYVRAIIRAKAFKRYFSRYKY